MQENRSYIKSFITVISVLVLLVLSCKQKEKVLLSLDFNNAPSWKYVLGVDVKSLAGNSSQKQVFSSNLRAFLQGRYCAYSTGSVTFTISGARVTSDFLEKQDLMNLKMRLEGTQLTFAPNEGAVYLPDTISSPMIRIGEWDLFLNFAKVLPILPENPVSAGDRWERERSFPLETNRGSAVGHLYQLFSLDSIHTCGASNGKLAYLKWLFTYRIELLKPDGDGAFKNIPLEGNGHGRAVVDLYNHRIKSADAFFEVPFQSEIPNQIGWNENIHLELIE